MIKYRAVQDEDSGEWVVDTCEFNSDNTISISRKIKGNEESPFVQYLMENTYEEAESNRQEFMLDTRYDIACMTHEQINCFIYNYIQNNNLEGFVYVTPLDVWTHSIYCDTKDFEFGSLSYVASEVAMKKDKKCIGSFYPFELESGRDHAHSFEEVLAVCVNCESFKPLEVEKYYSKNQLEIIDYLRSARQ